MNSLNPHERVRAIVEAADQRRWEAVPLLVDRLEDEDAAVRFFAIQSLERITGKTEGYRYYDPPSQRARAVMRWRSVLDTLAERATSQTAMTN